MLKDDPGKFREFVQETLRRHVAAINILNDAGETTNSFFLIDPLSRPSLITVVTSVSLNTRASVPNFSKTSKIKPSLENNTRTGLWLCRGDH